MTARWKPRLGFLGLGWIGRRRLAAVCQSGLADIAWLGDPDEDAVRAARVLAEDARAGTSLEDALLTPLDGLVIATPSAQHAAQATTALGAGLAVFCQKPLGRNAAEVKALVATARQANRNLGVDLSYRGTEALRTARRLLAEGVAGRVFAADATFHNAYGPDKPWFYDPRQSGGGCLIDLGTHLVDALLWLLPGETHSVSAWTHDVCHAAGGRIVEDFARVAFGIGDSMSAHVECSWRLHAGQDAVIAIDVYGTDAALRFSNIGGSFYDMALDLCEGTTVRRLVHPPDAWGGREIVEWVRTLTPEPAFDPAITHTIDVATVLDEAYSSARARRPQGQPVASMHAPAARLQAS